MFNLSDFYAVPAFIQFYHVNSMNSISDVSWIMLSVYTDLSVCKSYLTGCVFWVFFFQKGINELSSQHLFGKRSKLVWNCIYMHDFFFPFWYLCLFLSLLLKEEIPLGSQWERLVRFRLTAMASVCLILLSMFGVCVRIVCVHAHVLHVSSCKDGSHLSTCSSWRTFLECSLALSSPWRQDQWLGE